MDSKGLQELTDIYLKEISADTALAASKKADVERGKAAAGGDREKAKAKAAQASRLYKASAEKRKKEPVATPDRSYPKGKGASYREEVAALRGLVEKKKESYKTVAAVIDYDRSKKGTDDAVYDTEHGEDEKAKQERDYAAWERSKMKKDDPNWKHKKGSTSEEVEALVSSGKFSNEELMNIADLQEADIADILARLEKKRISKGGDPEESPLPAMKKYHADKKKKKVKEDYWMEFEEGYQRNPEKGEKEDRKYEKVRGERTPMPPRGNKRREEFERWYAANVR